MNLASLYGLGNNEVGSIFGKAGQGATGTNNNASTNAAASGGGPTADNGQLSPLAQILSTLQQVQQAGANPYQQLAQQIAAGLQQAAQQLGNTGAANQLNQLATDFTDAAQKGTLPSIQDLANVFGGGGQAPEQSSLSIQISFSETSISEAAPSNNNTGNVPANSPAGQQQQLSETALAYQINFSETSVSDATQGTPSSAGAVAANQALTLEGQQLLGLIQQSLQDVAKTAQDSGNAAEANLLKQLATEFTNALNNFNPASTQGVTSGNGGGDSYLGTGTGTASGLGSQAGLQQLQESALLYQINYSESSSNGNTTNQQAFSLSGMELSLSAAF